MKSLINIFIALFILFNMNSLAAESEWDSGKESLDSVQEIKVYRSPTCQCCHKWITHLEKHQFKVIDLLAQDMNRVKEAVRLPAKMASCHTALVGDYIIEGHVPADDIKRLLKTKPEIAGLSVPQMPVGTPGMEMGSRKDNFAVFSFTSDGDSKIYNYYEHQPDVGYQQHSPQH